MVRALDCELKRRHALGQLITRNMASAKDRALAVVLGSIGFLAIYAPLALIGTWLLAGRTVARGESDTLGQVILLSITGISGAAGGAIAASVDPIRWLQGALFVGASATCYFFVMYLSAGALVPYLAVLMTIAICAALLGGWVRHRVARGGSVV